MAYRDNGLKIILSKKEKREIKKCQGDPIYFIENYCKIISLDDSLQLMKLFPYQRNAVEYMFTNRNCIFNWGRQQGKSTIASAVFIWSILFIPYYTISCYADKDVDAMGLLERARTMYSNLPIWIQKGVVKWNDHNITLENGSSVSAHATTPTSGRSTSINWLYVDEMAHIPKRIWDGFWKGVEPTISSGSTTKILITSTPDGLNHFYDFYEKARMGLSNFKEYQVNWREHPNRDEDWKIEKLKQISTREFAQEYEVEFLGSAHTLIKGSILKEMIVNKRPPLLYRKFVCNKKFDMKIIYEPVVGNRYIIGVDIGEGVGLDYTVFSVINVSSAKTFKLVAQFVSNSISTKKLPYLLEEIGLYYNEALIVGENNVGLEAYEILADELNYSNVYYSNKEKRYGYRLSKTKRDMALKELKDIIDDRKLIIEDYDTIYELTRFVEIKYRYQADAGANDDRVMSLSAFAYFIASKERFRKYIADVDYMRTFHDMDVDDGVGDGIAQMMIVNEVMITMDEVDNTMKENEGYSPVNLNGWAGIGEDDGGDFFIP